LRIIQLIGTIIGAIIFFVASWAIISSNVNLDLAKVDQISGKVTTVGIATRVTKKYSVHQKVFRFKLDNYNYFFDAYRPSQEYSNLISNIKIGDSIKVYFRKWEDDNTATDIYQLEKYGDVLLDYKSYNQNFMFLGVFLILAGLFILAYGFLKFKRAKNNR
jgi:hypothetical protein